MSKDDILLLGELEVPFNKGKWSRLPALQADLALDLYRAHCLAQPHPDDLPGWGNWWREAKDPWGKLFQSKDIRPLDQHHRAMAETGLGLRLSRRKMQEPPLPDKGILARVVGMEWHEGIRDVLGRLPIQDNPSKARQLLGDALSHAIDLKRPASASLLVEFAAVHGICLSEHVPVTQLAKMWAVWSKSGKFDASHHVYEQSIRVLPVSPGSPQEVEVWNAWCSGETFHRTHEALAAWCRLMPGAWERMHQKSLLGEGVRCAWIFACRRARELGMKDPLWQEAIQSPSTQQWMSRLWPKRRSPLVAWMSDVLNREHAKTTPGSDKVSLALVKLGAPLPGSAEEQSLGGDSLIECVNAYDWRSEWSGFNPAWIQPNPVTGKTPLFEVDHWDKARKYVSFGLSWQHRDHEGCTAWNAFLANFTCSGKMQKEFSREAVELLAQGKLPLVDDAKHVCIAAGLAGCADAPLFSAYLRTRQDAQLLPLPLETQEVAGRSKDLLLQWKQFWVEQGAWSKPHEHAMWRGLLRRGYTGNLPLPASEDSNDPLWAWILLQQDYELPRKMELLKEWGMQGMSGSHPVWENPAAPAAWIEAVMETRVGSSAHEALGVNADGRWWVNRLNECRQMAEGASELIEKMHGLGLPLSDVAVVDALMYLPQHVIDPLPDAIRSVMQARALEQKTSVAAGTVRRHRL